MIDMKIDMLRKGVTEYDTRMNEANKEGLSENTIGPSVEGEEEFY